MACNRLFFKVAKDIADRIRFVRGQDDRHRRGLIIDVMGRFRLIGPGIHVLWLFHLIFQESGAVVNADFPANRLCIASVT